MVYRIYVEKKRGLALEAQSLLADVNSLLGITSVRRIHVLNRYDAENIDESVFDNAVSHVFSEPYVDDVYKSYPYKNLKGFAAEYLPGQFDMRADSAAQCIQLTSMGIRPSIRTAKIYAFEGDISIRELNEIKRYVINPVESREADISDVPPQTIELKYAVPADVSVISNFRNLTAEDAPSMISEYGLAMDEADLLFCRDYFRSEKRDITQTELKLIDTYWSDHCRHTTFLTEIDGIKIDDPYVREAFESYTGIRAAVNSKKPMTLMDIATVAVKYLKRKGRLNDLDESEEINACTVKIKVEVNGQDEDYLLLFKNETHNHPTEIEPFGGAATCIGGAIRDPLSGRAYVYAAMRLTGAADPTRPLSETLKGKLPQRKIVTSAAAGYSSYGNQIGLATGLVDEIYHDGYAAKRMEIGAVVAAVPASNVCRKAPVPGDIVILLGGKTGRDGCGGATGSSKSHTSQSLSECGAEVQKGNAPEERKLQRLFRNPQASKMIKRCNDFGAGGVSVAVGELADGLEINLDKVPKKYEGLDGTELAISESQERMAVVVSADNAESFCKMAEDENIEATVIATVTESPRLVMYWRNKKTVDLSRKFLNSNGAKRKTSVEVPVAGDWTKQIPVCDFASAMKTLAGDLNICSKRGLSERFDSTIGAGTVLMPFGGKYQLTPPQAMVNLIPLEHGHTDTCSFMSWGFDPFISEKSPYHGAYIAVLSSLAKLAATGSGLHNAHLTFQEYFEKPNHDSKRWGKPFAALLGALKAQTEFGIAAIGGKDSMSGSFESIDVPPTLVSFAVSVGEASVAVSPEFKAPQHDVVLLQPALNEDGLPNAESFLECCKTVKKLLDGKTAVSAWSCAAGGVAEGLMKMSFGNKIGVKLCDGISNETLFGFSYGSFILELSGNAKINGATLLGQTVSDEVISLSEGSVGINELLSISENRLESVFSCNIKSSSEAVPAFSNAFSSWVKPITSAPRPRVLIPVFPGTNCEYDTARAAEDAGLDAKIFLIRNLTGSHVEESVTEFAKEARQSQIIFIPGGFSGGDEPDGSGKFITAFFRSGAVSDEVNRLIAYRGGLMCGICNGFQALIKLGLVPYGEIVDFTPECTLTFNTIGRHQSKLVRIRVASNLSPWLSKTVPGDIFTVPISHGEGRFIASEPFVKSLGASCRIATQYVDLNGKPTNDIAFCPNGSVYATEGITSADGRILGKMGHSERVGKNLYKNVSGNYDMKLFDSAAEYFK